MKLTANKRTIEGKKVKQLRTEGIVPASVYGPKRASQNIQINKKDFIKLFKEVGYNKFFDLEIEGDSKPSKVLIKEIQKNPLSDFLVSASFYQVDEDTKIVVEVPVEIIGESPAVKLNLGFLIQQLDQVEVYCFPKDLPSSIVINIDELKEVGDGINVGDVKLPENVELSSAMDEDSTIVAISAPQKEEEVEKVEEVEEGAETSEAAEGADSEKTAE